MANVKPLISVIIPYYKAEKYIDQCIESILGQSEKNIEIIIAVDSKDSTGKKYLINKNWPKVEIIQGGNDVSANRNAGLEHAKGKYVSFIDSDDFLIRTDAFETMVKKSEGKGADMVVGEFDFYQNEKGEFTKGRRLPVDKSEVIDASKAMAMHFGGQGFMFNVCFSLIKRELIENTRFNEDFIVSEDFLFVLDLLGKHPKIYLEKDMVFYAYRRELSDNSDSKPIVKSAMNLYRSAELARDMVTASFPELDDIFFHYYFIQLQFYLSLLAAGTGKNKEILKEAKALYKEIRKKYLSFKGNRKKYLHSRKERILDKMISVNFLWRTYRILRILQQNKYGEGRL